MGDLHLGKGDSRLMLGGALGALAVLGAGRLFGKARPAVVGAVKEAYAFKEWAAGKYEKAGEDVEDIVAEAKFAYQRDLEGAAEAVKREKDVLTRIEELLQKKTSGSAESAGPAGKRETGAEKEGEQ